MKKFFLIILFLFNLNLSNANDNIVYIDINFILENSIVGKSINTQIKSLQNKENENFKIKEKKLIENEKKLISQKNILDENQFKNEVDKHKKNLNDYRNQKKIMFDNLNKKKSEYLKKVLNILNPIISKYVEENEISLVLQKNNIIVAKKELDITNKILDLLNEQIKEIKF
jgi:outer membrane protein